MSRLPAKPLGTSLYLPADGGSFAWTPQPSTWTPGDLDLRARVTPSQWVSGKTQTLLSQYFAVGTLILSWSFEINSVGNLAFRYSWDAVNTASTSSSVVTPFADARYGWVRVTYSHSDGVTKFYTSTNPADTAPESVTWTQLGTTRTITSGTPFSSGDAILVGTRDKLSGTSLRGIIGYWSLRSTIGGDTTTIVVGADLTSGVFDGTGLAGEHWEIAGSSWRWAITEVAVNGLIEDIAGAQVAAAVLPVISVLAADFACSLSSTTQQATPLSVAVQAGKTYLVEAFLMYDADATVDIQFAWSNMSGSPTMQWTQNALGSTTASSTATVSRSAAATLATALTAGGIGVGTKLVALPVGILVTGAAGNLTLTAAQATSSGSLVSTLRANSWLRAAPIA